MAVSYDGWEQLQALAATGLRIVHYQGTAFAALCDDEQIQALRRLGHRVSVLDPEASPDDYYFVDPFPDHASFDPWMMDDVYPYGEDDYIVRADLSQAEKLARGGLGLVKLPPTIAFPDAATTGTGHDAPTQQDPTIRAMVELVSPAQLEEHVCRLQDSDAMTYCNELGTRFSFSPNGLSEAASYLRGQYQMLGLQVAYEPFIYSGMVMTNVVAELSGSGPERDHILILCAHYDSISELSSPQNPHGPAPGADDNASGCAAVLEAARILSRYRFSKTLRFVHFAGEEQYLRGSADYARQIHERGECIDGVVNLDMIAYESTPPADHIVEIHAGDMPASQALADEMIVSIAAYGLQLQPQRITSGATWRSDHGSFWGQGYAAILGIEDFDDFNPRYHNTGDVLSNMQPELMAEFTKASVATMAHLAGVIGIPLPFHMYLPIISRVEG